METILIVDDEESIRQSLEGILGDESWIAQCRSTKSVLLWGKNHK